MDPVTGAIVAAAAGAATGAGVVASQAVVDAYNGLKGLIVRKFGGDSKIAQAANELEADSTSRGRQMVLAEQVKAAGAAQDAEIVQAAEALLGLMKQMPGGDKHVQTVIGNFNAVADGGSTASVSVNVNKPTA